MSVESTVLKTVSGRKTKLYVVFRVTDNKLVKTAGPRLSEYIAIYMRDKSLKEACTEDSVLESELLVDIRLLPSSPILVSTNVSL